MRYFVKLAYEGTNYHGWQIQNNAISVQEVLNKAFSIILGEEVELTGAGRTDAGVHAKEMYAHFDAANPFVIPAFIHRVNSYLPQDISIYNIILVRDDAHCRFDATRRTYEYLMHTSKNPFLNDKSWYFNQKLDLDSMNEAATILLNHTDFQSFSKVGTDVANFSCNIYEAHWRKTNEHVIFTISSNRFLRNMVRSIVGTHIFVGLGKLSMEEFEEIILSKSRSKAGFSVPAHGLYLKEILYDFDKIRLL